MLDQLTIIHPLTVFGATSTDTEMFCTEGETRTLTPYADISKTSVSTIPPLRQFGASGDNRNPLLRLEA